MYEKKSDSDYTKNRVFVTEVPTEAPTTTQATSPTTKSRTAPTPTPPGNGVNVGAVVGVSVFIVVVILVIIILCVYYRYRQQPKPSIRTHDPYDRVDSRNRHNDIEDPRRNSWDMREWDLDDQPCTPI